MGSRPDLVQPRGEARNRVKTPMHLRDSTQPPGGPRPERRTGVRMPRPQRNMSSMSREWQSAFQHMIPRRIAWILIVIGLAWAPLIAAPHLSNPRFSSDEVEFCGELRAVDLYDQTLLIWRDDGKVETVPFSRWTDFVRMSTDSRGRKVRQPIEATDIEIGERLFILLDPNGATAERVEVLPAWDEKETLPEKRLRNRTQVSVQSLTTEQHTTMRRTIRPQRQ